MRTVSRAAGLRVLVLLPLLGLACQRASPPPPATLSSSADRRPTLPATATIHGQVIDLPTAIGVPGATVSATGELEDGRSSEAPEARTVVTAADGTFVLRGVRPGIVQLVAASRDRRTRAATIVPLTRGDDVAGVEVWVDEAFRISGRVSQRPEPARSARGIRVAARDRQTGESVISPEESREDGYFEIPAVRPGTYAIDIERAGQPPRETAVTVVVAGANVGEIVVPLDPDPAPGAGLPGEGAAPDEAPRADRCSDGAVATITGEVRDALGRPAESVLVTARADHRAPAAASVLTSAQGGFVLRGVCGGPYRVAAYGLTTTTRASKAGVRPGDHVPLALGGLSTIVLRVRCGGRPSPEFFVALTGPVSRRERVEDADGEGRLRWLDPGSYELRVEAGDGLLVRAIDLEPNAVERIDLDLEKAGQAAGARDAAPP